MGDFIKGLIMSFNLQNIVNFMMNVSVEFSAYENPYLKLLSKQFFPLRIHQKLFGLGSDP